MFTLLCLLVIYFPFQIALNPASGIDLASGRVFILLFFLLWIFWGLKNKSLKIANNLITYFLLTFLFFAGLSCFWADNPERALRKLAVFLSIFPLYFIVVSLVDSGKKLERVLQCIIWPAVILALIGIGQFFLQFFIGIMPIMQFWSSKIAFIFWGRSFGAEVISNPSWLANVGGATYLRAFSLFPDPHMFSFYLGLVIPVAIGIGITNYELRIKKEEKKQEFVISVSSSVIPAEAGIHKYKKLDFLRRLADSRGNDNKTTFKLANILVVITLIIAQILTFSRGGYVGFGLFLLFGVVVEYRICHSREGGNLILKVLGVLFCGCILILIFTNNPVKQRFVSIFNSKDGSNIGRMEMWKQSLAVSENYFWTGVGIGNYSFYLEPRYGYRTPIYAHNTYLDILSEMGIFALISWIMLMLVAICHPKFHRRHPEYHECHPEPPIAVEGRLVSGSLGNYNKIPPKGFPPLQRGLGGFFPFSKGGNPFGEMLKRVQHDRIEIKNWELKISLIGSLFWFSGHAFFDTPIYSPVILPFLIIILGLISCLSYYHLE